MKNTIIVTSLILQLVSLVALAGDDEKRFQRVVIGLAAIGNPGSWFAAAARTRCDTSGRHAAGSSSTSGRFRRVTPTGGCSGWAARPNYLGPIARVFLPPTPAIRLITGSATSLASSFRRWWLNLRG